MDRFAPNAETSVEIDLVSKGGESITATSVTYDLYDDEQNKLVDQGTASFDADKVTVVVSAAHNTTTGSLAGRTIVAFVNTADGAHLLTKNYILESTSFLSVPSESSMTVLQADMLSTRVAQTVSDAWGYADDSEKRTTMEEAWVRVTRLNLNPWIRGEIPDDTLPDSVKCGPFTVSDLTSDQWALLPTHFKEALKRAQFIEACVLLDGDPTWERRQDGLISKTVGESSEMFRSGKPINAPLSPKSMKEISGYIVRTISISR